MDTIIVNREKRVQRSMKKNLLSLPRELLLLIFLRLPVKSLLRLRCVSKLCHSLVSDPLFATSHFELAYECSHKIMLLRSPFTHIQSIGFDASLHDDSAFLSFQLPTPFNGSRLIGSCRGFLLLLNQYTSFFLWNPLTGVHRQIPLSPIASKFDFYRYSFLYGFGYDPSTDDYLVVIASYDPTASDRRTQFEFFSLRANSWKKIEGDHLPYDETICGFGSLLNEAIHWLVFRHDGAESMYVILVFDLVKRSFSEIPLPSDFVFDSDGFYDLWVHGALLSLWIQGTHGVEIWVMEEYKVQSSWTKSIIVPYDGIPHEYFIPICSTESGIIGMDGVAGLVKCNAKGEVIEHRPYAECRGATMYVESLLSLPQ